jgi:hypothetical protein
MPDNNKINKMHPGVTFVLLLVCATAFEIQPSAAPSTAVSVAPNADVYIWLIQRSIMKGAPYMGFYANKTIYAFPDFNTITGVALASAQPTQLYFEIFDLLPIVHGKIDADAFLVKVPPQPFLYLINPDQGTKWMMANTTHTYQYGIDESKALIVNDEFLNRYPTQYIF